MAAHTTHPLRKGKRQRRQIRFFPAGSDFGVDLVDFL